jgi:hypothetical protein
MNLLKAKVRYQRQIHGCALLVALIAWGLDTEKRACVGFGDHKPSILLEIRKSQPDTFDISMS